MKEANILLKLKIKDSENRSYEEFKDSIEHGISQALFDRGFVRGTSVKDVFGLQEKFISLDYEILTPGQYEINLHKGTFNLYN